MSDVYRCSPEVDGWKKHVGSWSNCTRRMLSGHLLCGDGTYVEPNKDCTANPNMTTKELGLHYGQWTYRHTISYSLDSDPCPVARLRICSLCVKHFDSLVKKHLQCCLFGCLAWKTHWLGVWIFGDLDLTTCMKSNHPNQLYLVNMNLREFHWLPLLSQSWILSSRKYLSLAALG